MAFQIRRQDRSRVQREPDEAFVGVAAVDGIRHPHIRCLALPVTQPFIVGTGILIPEHIVEPDATHTMSRRRNGDDAGESPGVLGSLQERGFEQLEEQEMREMVGADLGLKPLGCFAQGCGHDSRVGDEDIESTPRFGLDGFRALADTGERVEVDLDGFGAGAGLVVRGVGDDVVDYFGEFGDVAGGEEEFGAGFVKGAGGVDADSGGAAGDEDGFGAELADEVAVFYDLEGGWTGIAGTVGLFVDGGVGLEGGRWSRHGYVCGAGVGVVVISVEAVRGWSEPSHARQS